MPFDENLMPGGGGGHEGPHDYEMIEKVFDKILKATMEGLVVDAGQCPYCSMWMGTFKMALIAVVNSPSREKALEDLQWLVNFVMEEADNQEHTAWSE